MLSLPTGSKLDLAVHCLHWLEHKWTDKPGRAAVCGTAFHELVSDGAHTQALDDHEEYQVQQRYRGWLAYGGARLVAGLEQEAAFCLHPDGTVSRLERTTHRDYGDAEGICGTLDAFGFGRCVDFKTGTKRPGSYVWQMRFAALVTDSDVAELHWIAPSGKPDVTLTGHPPEKRDESRATLIALQRNIADGNTPAQPGPHCDAHYCPARKKCSGYKTLKKQKTKREFTL